MHSDLSRFDDLPDEALVPVTVVAAVCSIGVSTAWQKAKTEPNLKPIVLGKGCTRFKVGPLRAFMAGKAES